MRGGEGAGAVRHATFERGVSFLETVDTWEPGHRLAFGIRAEAASSTTFRVAGEPQLSQTTIS